MSIIRNHSVHILGEGEPLQGEEPLQPAPRPKTFTKCYLMVELFMMCAIFGLGVFVGFLIFKQAPCQQKSNDDVWIGMPEGLAITLGNSSARKPSPTNNGTVSARKFGPPYRFVRKGDQYEYYVKTKFGETSGLYMGRINITQIVSGIYNYRKMDRESIADRLRSFSDVYWNMDFSQLSPPAPNGDWDAFFRKDLQTKYGVTLKNIKKVLHADFNSHYPLSYEETVGAFETIMNGPADSEDDMYYLVRGILTARKGLLDCLHDGVIIRHWYGFNLRNHIEGEICDCELGGPLEGQTTTGTSGIPLTSEERVKDRRQALQDKMMPYYEAFLALTKTKKQN